MLEVFYHICFVLFVCSNRSTTFTVTSDLKVGGSSQYFKFCTGLFWGQFSLEKPKTMVKRLFVMYFCCRIDVLDYISLIHGAAVAPDMEQMSTKQMAHSFPCPLIEVCLGNILNLALLWCVYVFLSHTNDTEIWPGPSHSNSRWPRIKRKLF